jgi:hypothetical protein
VRGGLDQEVSVDEPVELDASASSDPDLDDFSFEWADTELAYQDDGARRTVFPNKPGIYKIRVALKQVVNPQLAPPTAEVVLKVLDKLNVRVGEDHASTMEQARLRQLDGYCEGKPDSCTWTQSAGPVIANPECDPVAADGKSSCRIKVDRPGEYAFELVARRGKAVVRKEQRFLVFPKPVVWIRAPREAITGRGYELDGRASYDLSGKPLSYRWEVSQVASSSVMSLSDNDLVPRASQPAGVSLSAPDRGKTQFVAENPGYYDVRLCVTAEHRFRDRPRIFASCSHQRVNVTYAKWFVFLAPGGGYRSAESALWSGFRLDVAGLWRPRDWFGIRMQQSLMRWDGNKLHGGGGTFLGPALVLGSFSTNLSGFARTLGRVTMGASIGADVRLGSVAVLSGYAGGEIYEGAFEPMIGGSFGAGYDLDL